LAWVSTTLAWVPQEELKIPTPVALAGPIDFENGSNVFYDLANGPISNQTQLRTVSASLPKKITDPLEYVVLQASPPLQLAQWRLRQH
jgi:hypothetical protein